MVINREHSSKWLIFFEKTAFVVYYAERFAVVQGHHSGPIMGSLKSQYRTSCWSSVENIALDSLRFEETMFLCVCFMQQTDRQTEGQCHRIKPHFHEINN